MCTGSVLLLKNENQEMRKRVSLAAKHFLKQNSQNNDNILGQSQGQIQNDMKLSTLFNYSKYVYVIKKVT